MALVTLARAGKVEAFPVTGGTIVAPRVGAWVADVHVDAPEALAGKVELVVGGTTKFVGTIKQGALSQGIFRARIQAGGGGLAKLAKPRHYTSPTFRNVLGDLARDAGEAVAATSNAGVLGAILPHWTTMARTTALAIRALVETAPAGTAWRFLADGTLWVGPEAWPASGIEDWRELSETPEGATLEVGLDEPVLMPGTTLGERKVDAVEHVITAGAIRSTVWTFTG